MKSKIYLLKPTKSGTLESAYLSTLETINTFMNLINDLEEGHLLPLDKKWNNKISNAIQAGCMTIHLAKLHYPKLKFGNERKK